MLEEYFIDLLKETGRNNINGLICWLKDETDFFSAPASTKYHGSYKGGLLRHSYNVLRRLEKIAIPEYNFDSVIIVSLLNDICKANFYSISQRNVKNDVTGKWEKQPFYGVDEILPFGGHGSKSVYLIMKHGVPLTDEEAIAINCHMGGWDVSTYHNPSKAFEKYHLPLYLHIADLEATYLDDK